MSTSCQRGDSKESHRPVDPDHFDCDSEALLDGTVEKLLPPSWNDRHRFAQPRILNNILRDPKPYLISTILFLLPSFVVEPLRNYSSPPRTVAPKPPLSPTAWLDGLRGIAALTVYMFHWSMQWFSDVITDAYGAPGSANTIFQLPIVRTFNSGTASVATFFMISGYVITLKTLSTIYKGDPQSNDRVLTTLCGAFFRRPFRLFVPAIVSTFFMAVINAETGALTISLHRLPDLSSQLKDWAHETLKMMNVFDLHKTRYGIPVPRYNAHLWTIPIEFRNSILVFTLLLVFSKVKRWVHIMGVIGVGWVLLISQGDVDAALFCAGLILAEMTLIFPPAGKGGRTIPSNPNAPFGNYGVNTYLSQTSGNVYWARHFITITGAILGLHLMGYPLQDNVHASGFSWISEMTPKPFYPEEGSVPYGQAVWSIGIGAILYITSCTYSAPLSLRPHLHRWIPSGVKGPQVNKEESPLPAKVSIGQTPFLQIPHTTRFAQYLGWVSFSLYLCHNSVMVSTGMHDYYIAKPVLDQGEEIVRQLEANGQIAYAAEARANAWSAYVSAFVWASIKQTVVLFWVSDVFTRAIDANIVKMTRWLWGRVKTD